MQNTEILGIEVPRPFPSRLFDALHPRVLQNLPASPAKLEFQAAWNAVAYRYRAMHEAERDFAGSLVVAGPTPPTEERFVQEKALAHFFFDAVSCLDSLFYAFYAVGAVLDPGSFPFSTEDDRRQVTALSSANRYAAKWPEATFSILLQDVVGSARSKELRRHRIILFHRTNPGRYATSDTEVRLHPSLVSEAPMFPVDLDLHFLDARRKWIDEVIQDLLRGFCFFLNDLSVGQSQEPDEIQSSLFAA